MTIMPLIKAQKSQLTLRSTALPALLASCMVLAPATASANSSLLSGGGPATMTIDILPDKADNSIDLNRQRLLPVAIFGSSSFNIEDFNPRTLKLRAVSQNLVGKSDKTLCQKLDLNNDSYLDLLCDIKMIGIGVQPGEIPVTISAGTYQRESLRAEGMILFQAQ